MSGIEKTPELASELEERIRAFVLALVSKRDEDYEAEYVNLLLRVTDLVERKLNMEGTKTDTRDFLAEMLFTRMRRGMNLFMRSDDEVEPQRAAEWVMGLIFSVTTLSEFAKAFDESLFRSSTGSNKDFNFAGRTDFIAVEEVMQMLGSGKHLGCLSLEKGDNRLDIYIDEGRIWHLDPHNIVRRVLPGNTMQHREIPETVIREAEALHAQDNVPVLLTLVERGVLERDELLDVMLLVGKEILFDFMREQQSYAFYYRKLDKLPSFAVEHDLRLGVTSMLLEGSKMVDDWKQMLTVFPDPDSPVEPKANMFARMGDVALGVLEIKLLSQIDGDTTPRSLVSSLGLPLFDVYKIMLRLANEGIISAHGDIDALVGIEFEEQQSTMNESMQEAFEALDANDDDNQRQSAIDRVFGDEGGLEGFGGGGGENPLSALDRVLGGGLGDAPDADAAASAKAGAGKDDPDGKDDGAGEDLDQELLGILRRKP
ncbi:MAG: DUF4388 domain-containing protein [Planctomycetota bacterium]